MESCRDVTISEFNESIQMIRETAEREELDVRVTLTTFTHRIRVHFVDAPLSADIGSVAVRWAVLALTMEAKLGALSKLKVTLSLSSSLALKGRSSVWPLVNS